MMGRQKPGAGGTHPRAAGSTSQNAAASEGASRPQQRDMTDNMDQLRSQDPVPIDRWFDRQLNQLYSEVISEPLPKEFLELIDKLREKNPTK